MRRGESDPDFVEFVRARQGRLLRAAYLVCGDRQEAEDILQGALVKLALRWSSVKNERPDAYVRRIMYHDAVSAWRKRRREVVADAALIERAGGTDEPTEASELRLDLQAALGTLTPRQRAVIVLRYFDDLTEVDAAAALGVSVGTVKSQSHAALAKLRTAVPGLREPSAGGGLR